MKKSYLLLVMIGVFIIAGNFKTTAQTTSERLDLPGDNLNLYAVLKIFQESETLEIFEKKLNEEYSKINNLDLNRDGKIDYIKVIDNVDGDVHNIVLQDIMSVSENQDVAVIVVQKKNDNQVEIQVIGDEDLYGKNYIIEPNFETEEMGVKSTPNPGFTVGTGHNITVENTSTFVISSWPIIRFVYRPNYELWHSPYYWDAYPVYWHAWTPLFWHEYYGWHYHWNYYYYAHYRNWHYCRYDRWHNFYFDRRRSQSEYFNKMKVRGDFKDVYSRPELMRKGSNEFIKKYPQSPSAKDRLPKIDYPIKETPIKITPRHDAKAVDDEGLKKAPDVHNQRQEDIKIAPPVMPKERSKPIEVNPLRPIPNESNQIRPIEKQHTLPDRQPLQKPIEKSINKESDKKPAEMQRISKPKMRKI